MDRRAFLTRVVGSSGASYVPTTSINRPLSTGLEPYVPLAAEPWNTDLIRIGHLLRRTTMMPAWADMVTVSGMTPSAAVDLLLNSPSAPAKPAVADSVTTNQDGLDTVLIGQLQASWASDAAKLRTWFAGVMRDAGLTIAEKMTMFWSGHFTTQFVADQSYVVAPLLYRQNDHFRQHGLEKFNDLAMSMTLDGAMLDYLGGNLNSAGAPNENYARELMELFTIGLGEYTEGDVKNAAKILTGWRIAQYSNAPSPNGIFNTYFLPDQHDVGQKEVLGVSFAARDATTNTEFVVRHDEVQKLIDTLFSVRAAQAALFISTKIYRFFVYSNPAISDMAVIQAMADLLVLNNFAIKPVMSALLKSAHFFDNANIGAQIKTPAEFTVGLARQVAPKLVIDGILIGLGQTLFNPPNVSGWPGWHDWITTTTYPIRADAATTAIAALDDTTVTAFINQFPNYTDAQKLIANVAALLLPRALSAQRATDLLNKLTGNAPAYEWPTILQSPATAASNMRQVLTTISELPDFQLC
jgi:uncharacterized protein (DUF1800 family)